MANIKPVSDLRNYNTVLNDCVPGSPVYLTKNGRGKFVLIDMADYEHEKAERALLAKLADAELRVQGGESFLSIDDLKARLRV